MRRISEYVQHEVYTGSGEDAHGNEIDTWAAPVPLGIYAFNPSETAELMVPGHDRVESTPAIHLPSGAVVGPHDRITVRGKRYEVGGDARDYRNPYDSSMNGLTVNLRAVTG